MGVGSTLTKCNIIEHQTVPVQIRERCSIARCCPPGVGAGLALPSTWCRANFFVRFLITTLPPALRLRAVTLSPAMMRN